MVLLPTFNGIEKATDTTIGFIQSDEAKHVALQSLDIIKSQTPFGIGENIIAPCLVTSFEIMKKTWQIAQYPIPSKGDVRYTVDTIMTGTKWFLLTSTREIYFYAKLVDATVTRTLSHTQWRVLGSGPYSTLNSMHKEEVINHLCERYFSLKDDRIARYELTAHIKFHNRTLYDDLVVSGLLLERGSDLTSDDVWLKPFSSYRTQVEEDDNILLLQKQSDKHDFNEVKPLWFYQPTQNGKKPKKDTPWISFAGTEQSKIEFGFRSFLHTKNIKMDYPIGMEDVDSESDAKWSEEERKNTFADGVPLHENQSFHQLPRDYDQSSLPFNISHWYEPNDDDVLIEQKRQAISFLPSNAEPATNFANLQFPLTILMRPTLWRFHGKGNEVRRGVWLMDTQRNGLQPYSDKSAAILEDAYLFLKCTKSTQEKDGMSKGDTKDGIESVLLTVQVLGPDGDETQLVQFRSLSQITAIQKTIAGGFSLFKRRVYRGVHMMREEESSNGDVSEDRKESSLKSQNLLAAPSSLHKSVTSIKEKDDHDDNTSDHLILVVHGIGEMLRSTDVFGMSLPPMTSTLVDCCSSLRKNHVEVLQMHNNSNEADKASFSNVEYLPVEWHEAFALKSRWSPGESNYRKSDGTNNAVTLKDISLNTIPHMREFANDTMLDSKYVFQAYLSQIVSTVTNRSASLKFYFSCLLCIMM